ncbi:uncharacterized protein LOC135693528 isoform X2 [Rhopilema esculentum]|uniref:uncharacterized protein LOC135693528 isoform X2 n=1 Tax=Rhopilema esculentum TaxID=499914 RepID=UPI0031D89607
MGAESSILRSYVLGIPYEISLNQAGSAPDSDESKLPAGRSGEGNKHDLSFMVYPGRHKEDGSGISVFVYQRSRNATNCLGSACAEVEKYSLRGAQGDVVGFAKLALSILDCQDFVSNEERVFIRKLENEFCSEDKVNAESLKLLLAESVFRNSYLEITNFLNSVTMKTDMEKKDFFSGLADKLRNLNPETVAKKLLPKLMSKMMLAEPNAEKLFIPHLLTFKAKDSANRNFAPIFPETIFKKYCIPLVLKLFRSKQTHVRLVLLKYLSLFVEGVEKDDLESEILPLVLLGLRDENDAIVTATFHGLANLVPILGGAVVVGAERGKFFVDQSPKFSLERQSSAKAARRSEPIDDTTIATGVSIASSERQEMMERRREERRKQMELRREERERKRKEEVEANSKQSCEADMKIEGAPKETVKTKSVSFEADQTKRHEESEPDWEGFEAFSSGSASDEERRFGKLKPTLSAENLLMMSKGSLEIPNETPIGETQNRVPELHQIFTSKALVLGTKKKGGLKIESQYNRSDSLNSSASKDSDSFNQTDLYNHAIQIPPRAKTLERKSQPLKKEDKKELGGEFEIAVVKNTEPDFFADMTPDLSQSKTVLIEKKTPAVSAKFEAADFDDKSPSGWDDDDW